MFLDNPAWKFIFKALNPERDIRQLVQLASSGLDEDELLMICRDHGILLIVNESLKSVATQIFSGKGLARWRAEVATYTLKSLELHRELKRLLALFSAAGIPVAPFKGPTLSERLFGDPLLRMSVDLDFLMSRDNVAETVDILTIDGYQPTFNRDDLWRWLTPNSRYFHCGLLSQSQKWLVEIHWSLFAEWRKTRPGNKSADTSSDMILNDEIEMFIYLCNHGAKHWWIELKWVVDIDRFVRAAPCLDFQDLIDEARKRGCLRIVCLALQLARRVCGLKLPDAIEATIQQDPKVAVLAQRVSLNWAMPKTYNPSLCWKTGYLLDCRERFSDKLGMIFNYPLLRTLSSHARN